MGEIDKNLRQDVNDNNMEPSSKFESPTDMNTTSSLPRSTVHLDLFRAGIINRLDTIMSEHNASVRDTMIIDARKFADTYARAPPPAQRVPPAENERCMAIRAGGKQCSRRRKDDTTFCGTHVRYGQTGGNAHDSVLVNTPTEKPIQVGTERALHAAVSISGIPQFVDDNGATWCAEDVCSAHVNPRNV